MNAFTKTTLIVYKGADTSLGPMAPKHLQSTNQAKTTKSKRRVDDYVLSEAYGITEQPEKLEGSKVSECF